VHFYDSASDENKVDNSARRTKVCSLN